MTRRAHRPRVTKRARVDRATVRVLARLKGCTCRFELRHRDADRHGISHVHVAHDLDCPAASATSQLLIVPRHGRRP